MQNKLDNLIWKYVIVNDFKFLFYHMRKCQDINFCWIQVTWMACIITHIHLYSSRLRASSFYIFKCYLWPFRNDFDRLSISYTTISRIEGWTPVWHLHINFCRQMIREIKQINLNAKYYNYGRYVNKLMHLQLV